MLLSHVYFIVQKVVANKSVQCTVYTSHFSLCVCSLHVMRELDSKIVNCGVIKIMRVVNFKLCRANFVVNDIVLTD